jgi:hypothetical protein
MGAKFCKVNLIRGGFWEVHVGSVPEGRAEGFKHKVAISACIVQYVAPYCLLNLLHLFFRCPLDRNGQERVLADEPTGRLAELYAAAEELALGALAYAAEGSEEEEAAYEAEEADGMPGGDESGGAEGSEEEKAALEAEEADGMPGGEESGDAPYPDDGIDNADIDADRGAGEVDAGEGQGEEDEAWQGVARY